MHMAYTIAPASPISQRILWSSFFGNERFFFFSFYVCGLVGWFGWLVGLFSGDRANCCLFCLYCLFNAAPFSSSSPPSCSVPCPHVHYTTNTSRFNHSDFAKICLGSFNHSEKFVKY